MDRYMDKKRKMPLLGLLVMFTGDTACPWMADRPVPPMASAMSMTRAAQSRSDCVNPGRFANRLYQRHGRPPGYWRAADIGRHALDQLPPHAVQSTDGLYTSNGELYTMLESEGVPHVVRLLPEGARYRVRLQDGTPGPYARRQDGNTWSLSPIEEDHVQGSLLASIVPESVTRHALSLQHAAQLMDTMGVSETALAQQVATQDDAIASAPIVYFALAQAVVTNLPARLRDASATEWTAAEVRLVAPAMASLTGRPLVIEQSGRKHTFLADGREVKNIVPPGAVHVRSAQDRYLLTFTPTTGAGADHPSIFAAVEAATRPSTYRAAPPGEWEAAFRHLLADALEARSTLPELDYLLGQWIDTQSMPDTEKLRLKSMAHLRHALVDRHHALGEAEERRLLATTRALMPLNQAVTFVVRERRSQRVIATVGDDPLATHRVVIEADLDAHHRRIAYYRVDEQGESLRSRPTSEPYSEIIDATLNSGNSQVARSLGIDPWDWKTFTDRILKKLVDDEAMLLQPSHWYLTLRNKATHRMAKKYKTDRWSEADREYARLRNLAGGTQIVEISKAAAGEDPEILAPASHHRLRNTGHRLTWRDNKWYLPAPLRAPGEAARTFQRSDAAAAIRMYLPTDRVLANNAVERVLNAIPQLILPLVARDLQSVDVVAGSHVMLRLGSPDSVWTHRLNIDLSQDAVPTSQTPPSPATLPASSVIQPAPFLTSPTAHSSHSATQEQQLLAGGFPISQFIKLGIRNEHAQALVNARRLRGMLSEDTHMALVVSAAGHPFTVLAPIDAQAFQDLGWSGFAALPQGTRIIDSGFGIVTDAASYGTRLLAMAAQGSQNPAAPLGEAQRILAAPLRINVWNPRNDPISEQAYLSYIQARQEGHVAHGHAGLTWLLTPAAWHDYRHYLARPSDEGAPAFQHIGAPMETLLANVRELDRQHAMPATSTHIPSGMTPPGPSQAVRTSPPNVEGASPPIYADLDIPVPPFDFETDLLGPWPWEEGGSQ